MRFVSESPSRSPNWRHSPARRPTWTACAAGATSPSTAPPAGPTRTPRARRRPPRHRQGPARPADLAADGRPHRAALARAFRRRPGDPAAPDPAVAGRQAARPGPARLPPDPRGEPVPEALTRLCRPARSPPTPARCRCRRCCPGSCSRSPSSTSALIRCRSRPARTCCASSTRTAPARATSAPDRDLEGGRKLGVRRPVPGPPGHRGARPRREPREARPPHRPRPARAVTYHESLEAVEDRWQDRYGRDAVRALRPPWKPWPQAPTAGHRRCCVPSSPTRTTGGHGPPARHLAPLPDGAAPRRLPRRQLTPDPLPNPSRRPFRAGSPGSADRSGPAWSRRRRSPSPARPGSKAERRRSAPGSSRGRSRTAARPALWRWPSARRAAVRTPSPPPA